MELGKLVLIFYLGCPIDLINYLRKRIKVILNKRILMFCFKTVKEYTDIPLTTQQYDAEAFNV